MRQRILIRLVLVGVIAGFATLSAGATPPGLVSKQQQAKAVIAQIDAIDEQLSVITERFDTARVALQTIRKRITVEHASLVRARARYAVDELRAERMLVSLYTSDRPSTLELIVGAGSISHAIDVSEAESAIGQADTRIAAAAAASRQSLQERVSRLESDRAAAASTVSELSQARSRIERGLVQRQKLLVSVQAEINRIQAQERIRQARLAAEARARLAAEQAAAAQRAAAARRAAEQAQALQAARDKAAAAAQAQAAALAQQTTTTPASTTATTTPDPTTTTPDPTATATSTTSTTTTTSSDPITTNPVPITPALVPAAVLVPTVAFGGHPQAAQLALNYLGVPYLWGGSTPSGFDCSGLVMYVYAQLGVQLPHSAADQFGFGTAVARSQLQPGDLVFFDNLDHVGIYIGNNQFVDAPHTGAFVRIDSLSEPWYNGRYFGARRI